MIKMDKTNCVWIIIAILLSGIKYSDAQSNMCATISCDCTITGGTNLEILCDSTLSLNELPPLDNSASQNNVTRVRIASRTNGARGPLTTLPNNICLQYPNLNTIDFSYNNIGGSINSSMFACLGSRLNNLDLSNNAITDIDQQFFISNQRLQTLDFSFNNLTAMPIINVETFLNFPSTLTVLNFSFNSVKNADLWPLFVQTGNIMTIDVSNNLVSEFTNFVPVYVAQYERTPDARYYYLNNNRITRLSDNLLQQYGACESINAISTSYFVVGISNMLLSNNDLICDCESYHLVNFIVDQLPGFPQILNGSALINQAICSGPPAQAGQQFIFSNFADNGACANFVLQTNTSIFCTVSSNSNDSTIAPPTYWTSSTASTTLSNGNNSQNGNGSITIISASINGARTDQPTWYIILGVVLGVALIVIVVSLIIYYVIYSKKQQHGSTIKPPNPGSNINNIEGIVSIQTQTGHTPINHRRPGTAGSNPYKSTSVMSDSKYKISKPTHRPSLPATSQGTSTDNLTRGIPIGLLKARLGINSNTSQVMNTSDISVTQIADTASKRAKGLPPIQGGLYLDGRQTSQMNQSFTGIPRPKRQRRKSVTVPASHETNNHTISPPPPRPQSMTDENTNFEQKHSNTETIQPPMVAGNFSEKPNKTIRKVPLLNITVRPAWDADEMDKLFA